MKHCQPLRCLREVVTVTTDVLIAYTWIFVYMQKYNITESLGNAFISSQFLFYLPPQFLVDGKCQYLTF